MYSFDSFGFSDVLRGIKREHWGEKGQPILVWIFLANQTQQKTCDLTSQFIRRLVSFGISQQ